MDYLKLPQDWLQREIAATKAEVARWPPEWRDEPVGPQRAIPASPAKVQAESQAVKRRLEERDS